jgi:hypothetical protein
MKLDLNRMNRAGVGDGKKKERITFAADDDLVDLLRRLSLKLNTSIFRTLPGLRYRLRDQGSWPTPSASGQGGQKAPRFDLTIRSFFYRSSIPWLENGIPKEINTMTRIEYLPGQDPGGLRENRIEKLEEALDLLMGKPRGPISMTEARLAQERGDKALVKRYLAQESQRIIAHRSCSRTKSNGPGSSSPGHTRERVGQ